MPVSTKGAQRASRHRSLRLTVSLVVAVVFAGVGLAATPTPADAAGMKVVIVVGPAGSSTSNYISNAKKLAAQARSYGASVYEVYSPNATWSKVKSVAQGANVFIYLGHGNGYPSPYGAVQQVHQGRPRASTRRPAAHATSTTASTTSTPQINFAPNAVVILNRLCYASGNNEWGAGYPDQVHRDPAGRQLRCRIPSGQRPGGLRRGHQQPSYILHGLFRTKMTVARSSGAIRRPTAATISCSRRRGRRPWHGVLDPLGASRYYRSVVGDLDMTAAQWRNAAGMARVTR